MIGQNHKSALLTIVDKTSKVILISKLESKKSTHARKKFCRSLKRIGSFANTVTLDNGKEFAEHEKITAFSGAKIYFATPYHSWERGLNEHTNGLIRQYYPKTTDFNEINIKELRKVERELNDRPRKSLDCKTPREMFLQDTGFDLYVH